MNCQGYPPSPSLPCKATYHTSGCKDVAADVLMEQIPLPPSFPANVNSFLSYLEKKADANVDQVLSAV